MRSLLISMRMYSAGELVSAPGSVTVNAVVAMRLRPSLTRRLIPRLAPLPIKCTYRMTTGICMGMNQERSEVVVFVDDKTVSYPSHMVQSPDEAGSSIRQSTHGSIQEWMKAWL